MRVGGSEDPRAQPPGADRVADRRLDLPVQRDRRVGPEHDQQLRIGPGFSHRTGPYHQDRFPAGSRCSHQVSGGMVMGILLGLAAALLYGGSDFAGGLASRRLGPVRIAVVGSAVATVLAWAVLIMVRRPRAERPGHRLGAGQRPGRRDRHPRAVPRAGPRADERGRAGVRGRRGGVPGHWPASRWASARACWPWPACWPPCPPSCSSRPAARCAASSAAASARRPRPPAWPSASCSSASRRPAGTPACGR